MIQTPKPFIININKPAGITSYDVIRKWKPQLKKFGKVGHFGTLDPFADGVLMLGVAGAQRLNDYIHEYLPKTYLAKGFIGRETDTGDPTGEVTQEDRSEYLKEVIGQFNIPFIQEKLETKFLGDYWQSPHKFSAAKFQGKALHEWAREGVEIKKEQVKREVYQLEVVKFDFPHLWIRYQVSSGTYIRTLFRDCAIELGTVGMLDGLTREAVGGCTLDNASSAEEKLENVISLDPVDVLSFGCIKLSEKSAKLYKNGVRIRTDQCDSIDQVGDLPLYWVFHQDLMLGLCMIEDDKIISRVNFSV